MPPWVPLEANPELFSAWSTRLGLDTQKCAFHDIFGLDQELLAMVPQPVHAVLFLFPLTPCMDARQDAEDAVYAEPENGSEVLWFKQTIGNACGTIGLLHAIANSPAVAAVQPETPLARLLDAARKTTPDKRITLLEESSELQDVHAETAGEGQTAAPDADEPVHLHFIALVRGGNGRLLELDGRRRGPVERSVSVPTEADLLPAAAQFVQEYYVRLLSSLPRCKRSPTRCSTT